MNQISIHITREQAENLCDAAEILHHEDQIEGVPFGVLYDTVNDRWTWSIDEAAEWAIAHLTDTDPSHTANQNQETPR